MRLVKRSPWNAPSYFIVLAITTCTEIASMVVKKDLLVNTALNEVLDMSILALYSADVTVGNVA